MIFEFKRWITKCDGCGKEVEGTGPTPVSPPDWHNDRPTSYNAFSDGYASYQSILEYPTKHWCPDCWAIKDTIE